MTMMMVPRGHYIYSTRREHKFGWATGFSELPGMFVEHKNVLHKCISVSERIVIIANPPHELTRIRFAILYWSFLPRSRSHLYLQCITHSGVHRLPKHVLCFLKFEALMLIYSEYKPTVDKSA